MAFRFSGARRQLGRPPRTQSAELRDFVGLGPLVLAARGEPGVAHTLSPYGGLYLAALNCFDDARSHALHALTAARDVKATVLTAFVLQHLAAVGTLRRYSDKQSADDGRERAAMLLGYVDARLKALDARREYTEQQEYERVIFALRDALAQRLDQVMELGAEWTEDGAVALALEL